MSLASFYNQVMDALGRVERAGSAEPLGSTPPSPPLSESSDFTVDLRHMRSQKDFWDKLKIAAAVVFIPIVVALIPTTVNYREQLVSERQAEMLRLDAERQVQARAEEVRRQEAVSQAELASVLLPSITRGDPQERRTALEILSFVSPQLAQRLAAALMSQAATPTEKVFASTLAATSRRAAQIGELNRQFDIARQYCGLELHAQSVRTYFRAYDAAPEDIKQRLAGEIKKARALYDLNQFRTACLELEPVFAAVPRQ